MIPPSTTPTRIPDAIPVDDVGSPTIRIHSPPPVQSGTFVEPVPPATGGMKPLNYLRHHWVMLVFLGGFLALLFGYIAYSVVPSKYTTTALARVSTVDPHLGTSENTHGRDNFNTYLKTQAGTFRSQLVLNAALKKRGIASLPMLREQVDPIKFLEEELQIETQEGSELIKLKLSGEDPRAITLIVNAILEAHKEEIIEKELSQKNQRLTALRDEIVRLQGVIKRRYEELNTTNVEVGPVEKTEIAQLISAQQVIGQIMKCKEMLLKIEGDLISWESEQKGLEKRLENLEAEVVAPPVGFVEQLDKEPEMVAIQIQVAKWKRQADYLEKLNPENPEVDRLREQIKQQNETAEAYRQKRIEDYRKAQLPLLEKKLKGDTDRVKATIADLKSRKQLTIKEMNDYQATLTKQNAPGETPPSFLRLEITELQKNLVKNIDTANWLDLEVKAPPRVSSLQQAAIPQKKEMKKQLLATGMAALFGFALVGLGVVGYESRVKRVMSLADVRNQVLGPMLGVIPGGSSDIYDTTNPDTVAEAMDKFRAHLLQQFPTVGPKVVALCSALGTEGKAYLAQHLAVCFHRNGARTLVIDFDLRSPTLHTDFEHDNSIGFCEVLRGEKDLAEAIRVFPNGLMFLPAGNWTAAIRSRLRPEYLSQVFHHLREHCDCIVVNTHPVLTVADAGVLTPYLDAMVLCVERWESRLPMIARAQEKIASLSPEVFGIAYVGATADECLN